MSVAIAGFMYDAKSETLIVSFAKGGTHVYTGVPKSLVDAFNAASSKGKFFNYFIKNGGYG